MVETCGSKSTDKLDVLMTGIGAWPAVSFTRLKTVNITWDTLEHPDDRTGTIFVPNLHVEFFDK